MAIQYAKKVFNTRVVAVDINQDKLYLAKESGADLVVNGKEVEDVAGYIQEKTGGTHSAVVQLFIRLLSTRLSIEYVPLGSHLNTWISQLSKQF